jgi:hypothetical protein
MVAISQPPTWLQNGSYSARLDRNLVDLFFTEGVLAPGAGDYEVLETTPVSNSVAISAGRAVIAGDDEANQGKYLCVSESTLNLALSAAPVSNSRIDLVYLRVNDPVAGGPAGDNATIEVLAGTAAPSPVVPATPTTAIPLAEILRTAGDTYVDQAMITDVRPTSSGQTFTVRSNFEILTTVQRLALTPYAGQTVYDSTDNLIYTWDGSDWLAMGFPALTTAERNALTPYIGQAIFNTDVNAVQVYNGVSWDSLIVRPVEDADQIIAISTFA